MLSIPVEAVLYSFKSLGNIKMSIIGQSAIWAAISVVAQHDQQQFSSADEAHLSAPATSSTVLAFSSKLYWHLVPSAGLAGWSESASRTRSVSGLDLPPARTANRLESNLDTTYGHHPRLHWSEPVGQLPPSLLRGIWTTCQHSGAFSQGGARFCNRTSHLATGSWSSLNLWSPSTRCGEL